NASIHWCVIGRWRRLVIRGWKALINVHRFRTSSECSHWLFADTSHGKCVCLISFRRHTGGFRHRRASSGWFQLLLRALLAIRIYYVLAKKLIMWHGPRVVFQFLSPFLS